MSFNRRCLSLAVIAAVIGYAHVVGQAWSQTMQPPATPPQVIPPPVPPGSPRPNPTIPEKQGEQSSSEKTGSSGTSLSDKLEKSHGVVRPPANTDSGIVQPVPNPGTSIMPVIPPPGSPGGRQDVIPK